VEAILAGMLLWNRRVLSRKRNSEGVMDEQSGELTAKNEVTGAGRGELKMDRLGWGWRRDSGSWFQRQAEAGRKERSVNRNNVDEQDDWQVMKSDSCKQIKERWNYINIKVERFRKQLKTWFYHIISYIYLLVTVVQTAKNQF